jgi:hypothetical protein
MRGRLLGLLAALLAGVALLHGAPAAQARSPMFEREGRESLAARLARAEYVDPQNDTWRWQLTNADGCTLTIRQTIHAPDGPLVTDYDIDLADLGRTYFANGWVSVRTRGAGIRSRTYLRIGEPADDHGDSLEVRFGDPRMAVAAAQDISLLGAMCRMRGR